MKLLQVNVPEDLYEAFRDVAYRNGETVSAVVRHCMRTVVREEQAIQYPSRKESDNGDKEGTSGYTRTRLGSNKGSEEATGR
jgi:metal-responsive CopG/Arc/MetJ family transcriptional regulator